MLVLSRKASEVIVIGSGEEKIEVKVMAISDRRCKIGIEAPSSVKILRGELEESDDGREEGREGVVS